jgi:hypothetical protein
MDLTLISIIIGLVIYSSWIHVKYSSCKKRGIEYTKEYKRLKEDYFELVRDLKDIRNKNILLESVIRTIKSK